VGRGPGKDNADVFYGGSKCEFPEHSHESEQITMVLSGSLYFSLAGKVSRAGEGETGGGGKFIRSWKAIEHK